MGKKNPRVDAYIEESQDFAKPILTHIRKLVHQACPDVEEKIKWGFPHFDYKGMMCSMASFKNHCSFENFSYSNKKEYVDWIVEAKTEDTRKKRLDTAVEWLSQGKVRNWKYLKK